MTNGSNAKVVPNSIRNALAAQLRDQWDEIEAAVYSEVRSISMDAEDQDPVYLLGLRAAAAEMIDYGIRAIERGNEGWSSSIPLIATAQARQAARRGVGLGTLLRGIAAADRKLVEFVLVANEQLSGRVLRQVLREKGGLVDQFMTAVSDEYMREWERYSRSPAARLSARLKHLLATSGPVAIEGVNYVFERWHLGLIAVGGEAEEAIRALASAFDREALVSLQGNGAVWAWLGGRRPLAVTEIERFSAAERLREVSLAVGEPRSGVDGWRLTHHEAKLAFSVMLRRPQWVTRGRDVALLAAVMSDVQVTNALRETYLRPLMALHSGPALRRTLEAYISVGFNAASASQILQIDRSTVQRHVRKIEEQLDRPLHECHAELKVVLGLDELTGQS